VGFLPVMRSEQSVLKTVAFFIMRYEPVFSKPEPGYGIVSVSSPWPAPKNPSCCHEKPPYRSVYSQSIKCILRTGRYMPARRPQKRRYGVPVKMDGEGKQLYGCRFQNLVHGAKIGKWHKVKELRKKNDEGSMLLILLQTCFQQNHAMK